MKNCASLTVKGIELGKGSPKICVPLTGRTIKELENQAAVALNGGADLVEVRIDYFVKENGIEDVGRALDSVRKKTGNLPVIFTLRNKREGGEAEVSLEEYREIVKIGADNNRVDIIDVELNLGEDVVRELCHSLKEKNIFVVVSNHDFDRTIGEKELSERMEKMQSLGADIVKVAMMPKSKSDVLMLMKVTMEMGDKLNVPLVTMSMGKLGLISRLCGEFTGSAITFASIGETSAPGQMEAKGVKQCLDLIHNNL